METHQQCIYNMLGTHREFHAWIPKESNLGVQKESRAVKDFTTAQLVLVPHSRSFYNASRTRKLAPELALSQR